MPKRFNIDYLESREAHLSETGRRLAAIMFTDMVGYTALGQKNESLSLVLVKEQRNVIRQVLSRHNGREIKTIGDAFLVEFSNALDAVRCAYDIQRATRQVNFSLPEDRRIHLRVGIHLGDVVESEGDISGDAVNIASRIEQLAEDGGVCLTREVHAQVGNKFDLPLVSLGPKSLRNVTAPVEVFKMSMPWEEQVGELTQLDKMRIAVLPISNISPDPNDEYIADGLVEELISRLSEIGELSVISRTSTARYRDKAKSIMEIGKELGAGTVLEGSVRKVGNRIRVTIQMIDAATDKHAWAETYDRELSDIFAVQSDIAGRLAETLRVKLLQDEKLRIGTAYTNDVEAHTLYLRGLSHLSRLSPGDTEAGLNLLEAAVARDPLFAAAHAALSEGYTNAAGETMPRDVGYERARKHALKAIEIREGLADGHASLGILSMQSYTDSSIAPRELKRAIELNPSHASAHQWLGLCLANREGDFEGALGELRKAEELDPFSAMIKFGIGYVLFNARRYPESVAKLRESSEHYLAHVYLGFADMLEGKTDDALAELRRGEEMSGGFPFALGALGYAMGKLGMRAEAVSLMRSLQTPYRWGSASPYSIAMVHLGLGEDQAVLSRLEEAAEKGDENLILFNPGVSPLFESLRTSLRFQGLLKRLDLAIQAPA